MILLSFFLATALMALLLFFVKHKAFHFIIVAAYLVIHSFVTVFAYEHINSFDSNYFKFDSLSVLLSGLLSLILFPIFFHTRYYLQRHIHDRNMKGRFLSLLMILSTGITGIYFADNVVIIWVCLEVTTVAVTFLIYHERYTAALEAAWKYLFISSFGITLAFIGILFLSVQYKSGSEVSLSFSHLLSVAQHLDPLFLKASFLMLITGYSIKLNLFPLYAATIDAKTTAPFPVNALTSTALINGGFVAIFRIYLVISQTDAVKWANHVLLIVGLISIFIVSIQLFRVKRFKRMYAFSSMEHMALIIIALSLGKAGLFAAILHLTLHTLTKTGLFLHFGQLRAFYQSGWMQDTGNLMKLNGRSAFVYVMGILTATAVPPSGMFLSELLIFKALFQQGQYYVAIALIFILSIIIFVIFKYSIQLLFGETSSNFKPENAISNRYEPLSQIVLFSLVFYVAYFPPPFISELMNSIVQMIN